MSLQSELEQIRKEHGKAHPEDILTWASKHPKSDWHKRLEWDDKICGHAYRLQQVRAILVTFKTISTDNKPATRAYFTKIEPETKSQDRGYTSTAQKMLTETGRIEIALTVLYRMIAHYDNYPLDEIADIAASIRAKIAEFEEVLGKSSAA